ncbi:hypothetical protein OAS39_10845 [Pirellulales bacterium]|nr:hypothetical protein [Pirellulales bacterium]
MKCLPWSASLPLLLLGVLLVGCGDPSPAPLHVRGKVTYRGEPIPAGSIVFQSVSAAAEHRQRCVASIDGGVYDTRSHGGEGGYHDYEMVFDPTTQTVDVLADGNLVIDDMLPLEFTSLDLNRILWGSNASGGTGNANYSFIGFQVVPEPATMALALTLAGSLAPLRRRVC